MADRRQHLNTYDDDSDEDDGPLLREQERGKQSYGHAQPSKFAAALPRTPPIPLSGPSLDAQSQAEKASETPSAASSSQTPPASAEKKGQP